jgi:hypothetical protein
VSTLITYTGIDRNGYIQHGDTLTDDVATLDRLVHTRYDDDWRDLTVRDLDHGCLVGGIEHTTTNNRIWWTR